MLVPSISVHSDISTGEKGRKAAHNCRRVNNIVLSYIRLPILRQVGFYSSQRSAQNLVTRGRMKIRRYQTESRKVLAKGHNWSLKYTWSTDEIQDKSRKQFREIIATVERRKMSPRLVTTGWNETWIKYKERPSPFPFPLLLAGYRP